jgi:EmrB/QacA subfamily drug resistance transporter
VSGHSATSAHDLSPRAKLEILFAVLLALFMFALDQTIVGVALPSIISELNGASLYTWSVTIYLLTSTISGPIYGKLSDLFGRRPIFIFAVGLFLIASVGAGLSQEMWQFILFRGLQGLGGGAVFPLAFAVLADMYTPAERGKYSGFFGAVFGLSSILGPAIGGLLVDNLSWHWIFFVNVPVAAVALFVIYRLLPAIKHPDAGRNIDYVGAALFTAAIGPFLVGLTNAQDQTKGWTDPWVGGLMLVGLLIGVVFLWWERRVPEPLINFGLFRNRTFTLSVTAMFLVSFGFLAAIIYLPLWFQVVKGSSATISGYQLLPLLGALIVSATLSGQIVARTHRYKWLIVAAMVSLTVGLLLMTQLRATTDVPVLWLWMIVTGLGIGPAFAVFTLIVSAAVEPRQIGQASSSLTFFQQIGGTIGLTIGGTIFANTLTSEVPKQMVAGGVPAPVVQGFAGNAGSFNLTGTGDLGQKILDATPPEALPFVQPFISQIVGAIHEAISLGIANALWLGIGASIIAVLAVLMLKEVPLTNTWEEGASTAMMG